MAHTSTTYMPLTTRLSQVLKCRSNKQMVLKGRTVTENRMSCRESMGSNSKRPEFERRGRSPTALALTTSEPAGCQSFQVILATPILVSCGANKLRA